METLPLHAYQLGYGYNVFLVITHYSERTPFIKPYKMVA